MDGGLYSPVTCAVNVAEFKSSSGPSSDKDPCVRGQAPSQRERCYRNAREARLESFGVRGILLPLPMSMSHSLAATARDASLHLPARTRYLGWLYRLPAATRLRC